MEVRFADAGLDRLERDPSYTHGLSQGVVRQFRKRMNLIRSAQDERDLRVIKSHRFEKLLGRNSEYSIRLNDQWRLILGLSGTGKDKTVVIIGIEDYHK